MQQQDNYKQSLLPEPRVHVSKMPAFFFSTERANGSDHHGCVYSTTVNTEQSLLLNTINEQPPWLMHNFEKHARITVKLTIQVSKYFNFTNVLTTLPVSFSTFETSRVRLHHQCVDCTDTGGSNT